MPDHSDYCVAVDDEECAPDRGDWNQPPGTYVQDAKDELDADAPWCAIQERAWELAEADE